MIMFPGCPCCGTECGPGDLPNDIVEDVSKRVVGDFYEARVYKVSDRWLDKEFQFLYSVTARREAGTTASLSFFTWWKGDVSSQVVVRPGDGYVKLSDFTGATQVYAGSFFLSSTKTEESRSHLELFQSPTYADGYVTLVFRKANSSSDGTGYYAPPDPLKITTMLVGAPRDATEVGQNDKINEQAFSVNSGTNALRVDFNIRIDQYYRDATFKGTTTKIWPTPDLNPSVTVTLLDGSQNVVETSVETASTIKVYDIAGLGTDFSLRMESDINTWSDASVDCFEPNCDILEITLPTTSSAVSVYDGGDLIPLEYTADYALISRDILYGGTKVGTQTMLLYYPCFGKTYEVPGTAAGGDGDYYLDNSEVTFDVSTSKVPSPKPSGYGILNATYIPKPVLRIAEDYGPAATPFTLQEMTAEPWAPAARWGMNGTDPTPTNGFVGYLDAANSNRPTPYTGLNSGHALIGQEFLFDDIYSGVTDLNSQFNLDIQVGTTSTRPSFKFRHPSSGTYGPVDNWDNSVNGYHTKTYYPPDTTPWIDPTSLIARTDFPSVICERVRDAWGEEPAGLDVRGFNFSTQNVTDGTNNLDGKWLVSLGFRNTIGPYKPAGLEGGSEECPIRDSWDTPEDLRMLVTNLPNENRPGAGSGPPGEHSWLGESYLDGYNSDYILYQASKTNTVDQSYNGVREVVWRFTDEGFGLSGADNAGQSDKYGLLDFTVTFTETWSGSSSISWQKSMVANIAGGRIEAVQTGTGALSSWGSWYCSSNRITVNEAADGVAWNLGSALFNMAAYSASSHPNAKPSATCITNENATDPAWDDWRSLCVTRGGCSSTLGGASSDNCGQPNIMTPRGSAGYYDGTGTQLIQVRETGAAANDPGVFMKWSGDDELQAVLTDMVFTEGSLKDILTVKCAGTYTLGFGGARSLRAIDTNDDLFFYCPDASACTNEPKRSIYLPGGGGWLTAFQADWERSVEAIPDDPNPTITTGTSIFMLQVALRRRFPRWPALETTFTDRRVCVSVVALSKDVPAGVSNPPANVLWQVGKTSLAYFSDGTLSEDGYVSGSFPTTSNTNSSFNLECCSAPISGTVAFDFTVSQL